MANANCGGLLIDGVTLVVNATTKELEVASGVTLMPVATDSTLGGVIPDGTVITVSELGEITVPDATDAIKGVVKQSIFQADSTAVDVAGIVSDFNTLLSNLQTAGLMATS